MNIIEKQVLEQAKKVEVDSLEKAIEVLGETKALELLNLYIVRREYNRLARQVSFDINELLKKYGYPENYHIKD